jgi:hypothetical protein
MAQFIWTAYAALQSGGQTTWAEFDMEPGTYAVICFIIDPATGRPRAIAFGVGDCWPATGPGYWRA